MCRKRPTANKGSLNSCRYPGTTTCCWYGTLHLEATKQLAEILHKRGQRAFVGKCNMDRHSALDYVEKTAAASIDDTKEFVRYVRTQCCDPDIAATADDSALHRKRTSSTASSNSSAPAISPKTSPKALPSHGSNIDTKLSSLNGSAVASPPTSPSSGSPLSPRSPRSATRQHGAHPSSPSNHHSHSHSNSLSRHRSSTASSTARSQAARHAATALVQPILTPRFAISCSDALMAGLQAMVAKGMIFPLYVLISPWNCMCTEGVPLFFFTDPTLHIQTHLAENPAEIEFTKQLFPFADHYTQGEWFQMGYIDEVHK